VRTIPSPEYIGSWGCCASCDAAWVEGWSADVSICCPKLARAAPRSTHKTRKQNTNRVPRAKRSLNPWRSLDGGLFTGFLFDAIVLEGVSRKADRYEEKILGTCDHEGYRREHDWRSEPAPESRANALPPFPGIGAGRTTEAKAASRTAAGVLHGIINEAEVYWLIEARVIDPRRQREL
jgi:hypothetical protein